ncbi:patatin-like phospholipase family protein [Hydrogenovibrio marinus]|uniref:Serine protease n=1 Tax=Hydrogenovibrio marinus TaxID=28885 RepID=A0A067A0D3_HYDMR|nr:patatin-like phospholipase family protein [Hydrogenovibrio marinus]KDN96071.1 serine protease [Hydrogenovibrio marinus]BBN58432.1 serine protease [Hydrogenovibrio marinus]
MSNNSPKKTISLVLGSGGARGLAHIGVIRWLEEHDFEITSISGCSMGSLIGGIYAMGKLDDFEEWVCAIRKMDMVALLDISWQKNGLVKGDKIINSLIDLVGNQLIEELPVHFTAVATDIQNQKEVWLRSGKLFDAIRASISLPLFFTPMRHNGIDLIDGGVLNPVPIAPTFGDATDLTIAANLNGDIQAPQPSTSENSSEPNPFYEKVHNFIRRFTETEAPTERSDWSIYDIANQAFDAMQTTISRQKLAAYPPDYLIEIASNACGTLEFDRAKEMIRLGYDMADEQLNKLITSRSK